MPHYLVAEVHQGVAYLLVKEESLSKLPSLRYRSRHTKGCRAPVKSVLI